MVTTRIASNIFEDFEHFYERRRFSFHFIFWLCLLSLYTLDMLLVNSAFSFNISFVLATREVATSLFTFYFVCYLVMPQFFLSGKYVPEVIALFIPFILAPFINFLTFIILDPVLLRDKVSVEYVQRGLFVENLRSVFTLRPIVLSFMPLLLRTMPAFVMKLLVSTIRYFYNSRLQQEKERELERNNFQLEINFLKSQINPHFFFNTLNNIYSYVYLKNDKALDLISDLSEIMRYTLYATKDSFVPLEQELKFLEHYISLEKTRFNQEDEAIVVDFDYNDLEGYKIAPLLLFPFLENAFKYGLGVNKKKGWLKATAELRNGDFYFFVENNKPIQSLRPPIKERIFLKEQRAVGGIGVAGTKRRLSLLYKDKHDLIINDQADAYSVSLKLNCQINEPKVAVPYC